MEDKNLQIVPGQEKAMSKNQKLFNSRIRRINEWKAKLDKVKQKIEVVRKEFSKVIAPIESKVNDKRFELICIFDAAYDSTTFKKKEKEKLNDLVLEIANGLVQVYHNDQLKAIYQKHTAILDEIITKQEAKMTPKEKEMAEEEQKEVEDMGKSMLEDMIKMMTGMDIDVENLDDFEHIRKQVEEQQAEQEAEYREQFGRQKTDKQKQKIKDQAAEISKTSRKIYTELIKLLHPDRSKDETERVWKTEAVKEVTEAYEKNDFFSLLQLQMKYLDQAKTNLDNLNEKQLDYYNKILLEQMKDLEDQYLEMTQYGPESEFYQEYVKSKSRTKMAINEGKREMKFVLKDLEKDVNHLSDEKRLKRFLKTYEIDINPMNMFDSLFDF